MLFFCRLPKTENQDLLGVVAELLLININIYFFLLFINEYNHILLVVGYCINPYNYVEENTWNINVFLL